MVERGGGAIVNVASVNAFFQPDGGVIDYGAAKAALVNLTKSLSQEFGPRGIRVNCVSPGPVATDLWLGDDGVAATVAEGDRRRRRHRPRRRSSPASAGFATGRFTTPEEVATLVVLLASDRARQRHGRQLRHRRRPDQDDVGAGSRPSVSARPPTIISRPLTSATVSGPTMPSWPGNWPAPPSGPRGTAMAAGKRS